MRRLLRVALALAPLAACTDSTTPPPAVTVDDTRMADARFGQLADEARMSGDTALAALLTNAQVAVGTALVPATVSLTENGVTEPWRALAFRTVVPASCPTLPTPTTPPVCRLAGSPSLVAYSTRPPARVLMVTAPEGRSQVPGPTGPTPPSVAAWLRGTYVDQQVTMTVLPPPQLPGGPPLPARTVPALWVTTAGEMTQTTTASEPCERGARAPGGAVGRCTVGSAQVSLQLDVTQQRPGQSAGPTRRLAMTASSVPAMVWTLDSLVPPPVGPGLVSRLEVTHVSRDSVSLRLVVRNVGRTPVVLGYPTAQRADFQASVGGSRGVTWTWSAGQAFSTVATQDTLAPDAERRSVATWVRPPRGSYVVTGFTTNVTGPRALSVAPVVVP